MLSHNYMMKNWLSIIAVIAFCWIPMGRAAGQIYTPQQIIHVADSLLRARVGDSLFPYYTRRSPIQYAIKDSLGDVWPGNLTDTSNPTHGDLQYILVSYLYSFTYPKCPQLPPMNGETHIDLDAGLRQTNGDWVSFPPEWMVKNLPCNFISEAEAVKVARKAGIRKGPEPAQAHLEFYSATKDYVWMVSSKFTNKRGFPATDMLTIDATTGKVIFRIEREIPPPVDIDVPRQ